MVLQALKIRLFTSSFFLLRRNVDEIQDVAQLSASLCFFASESCLAVGFFKRFQPFASGDVLVAAVPLGSRSFLFPISTVALVVGTVRVYRRRRLLQSSWLPRDYAHV